MPCSQELASPIPLPMICVVRWLKVYKRGKYEPRRFTKQKLKEIAAICRNRHSALCFWNTAAGCRWFRILNLSKVEKKIKPHVFKSFLFRYSSILIWEWQWRVTETKNSWCSALKLLGWLLQEMSGTGALPQVQSHITFPKGQLGVSVEPLNVTAFKSAVKQPAEVRISVTQHGQSAKRYL